ncbi:hypothetical protein X753_21790 [Mesorhizobium sp. LNJC399B00]|nr:hypothetical protein X753_21790 [Mesorhizobium sp. LNJC399B00]
MTNEFVTIIFSILSAEGSTHLEKMFSHELRQLA